MKKKHKGVVIIFLMIYFLIIILVDGRSKAEVRNYVRHVGLIEISVEQGKGYEHYIRIPNSIHRQTMVNYIISLNEILPHQLRAGDVIIVPTFYEE